MKVGSGQVADNSLRSVDIRDRSIKGVVARGTLRGDNVASIARPGAVVVGTQNLTVAQPSRIWVHGQGALNDNGSVANELGLFLRLRDAGDATTLATTTSLVDREDAGDGHYPLSPGGILLTGSSTELPAPAFVAPPGAYILQLVAQVGGPGCGAGPFPSFGFNSGSSMGYPLVGNG